MAKNMKSKVTDDDDEYDELTHIGRFLIRGLTIESVDDDSGSRHEHFYDENGRPAGGASRGIGFSIRWQNGPLGENPRNGAQIEDIIRVCISRLAFFQSSEFQCIENEQALEMLNEALGWLEHRTAERTRRGVEGTHIR